MIFDQNRGSERSWTNIDPVGVTILLPSDDFVLLNHSIFKPFECYSDRLLGDNGFILSLDHGFGSADTMGVMKAQRWA
jgi:hypothetical protein